MAVNDLNGVKKKDSIEQNWWKLKIFEHKIKIKTYLTKLEKNWNKKSILT